MSRISLLPSRPWMPITADEYGLREHWLCMKREAGLARPKESGDLPRERDRERKRKTETIHLSRREYVNLVCRTKHSLLRD